MTDNILQGALFTVMVMRVGGVNGASLEQTLRNQITRSPQFFANAPIVLDLKDSGGFSETREFLEMKRILASLTLVPVGVQNANPEQRIAALAAGLGTLTAPATSRRSAAAAASAAIPSRASATPAPAPASQTKSLLITEPVRSGTQIYAPGGDIIVVRSVSAGAEIIADGHIHVYGALRGRAIAGATGDASARIFVGRLEAELVSIAGRYLIHEDIAPAHLGQRVQIVLQEQRMVVLGSG
ncbi:MAG TPA: septum site-determining protein MinC [Stellaceae bacterium]|jgi:septum site-determining protein MinC|nr:septum site-determining protein MinC [Stellaceae bacterium]